MNFFKKITSIAKRLVAKSRLAIDTVEGKLAETEGASEHTDKTVWIVIGIVLGLALLTALGIMFKDTLIPAIQAAIQNIFNVTI